MFKCLFFKNMDTFTMSFSLGREEKKKSLTSQAVGCGPASPNIRADRRHLEALRKMGDL